MPTHFNYIITIHNKENLIEQVVQNVIKCMHENSTLYTVLDGCTDTTENIIDKIIKLYPTFRIQKIYADDVHELKSINIGLKASNQQGNGYNIILQDDVILNGYDIEAQIIKLYDTMPELGITSFRHGFNLSRKLLSKKVHFFPSTDYIESILGHNPNPVDYLKLGYFTYREIAVKSPICIPYKVVQKIGYPDEIYAPWDDIAYCYKASQHNFFNGVYALSFQSDVEWGTTRIKKQKLSPSLVEQKNVALFKKINNNDLLNKPLNKIYSSKKKYLIDNHSLIRASLPLKLNSLKFHFRATLLYFYRLMFAK